MDDILRIVAAHRGRTGDPDVQWLTLDLLFEETAGDLLTSEEANALIENLYLYLDDGSNSFDSTLDTAFVTLDTAFADGRLPHDLLRR